MTTQLVRLLPAIPLGMLLALFSGANLAFAIRVKNTRDKFDHALMAAACAWLAIHMVLLLVSGGAI